MFPELLAILIGSLVGIITGLTPGVHINLIATLIVSFSATLLSIVSPTQAVMFIMSMSITHNFLDYIPSTYLAAPTSDTCEGALPAHQLLFEGKGHTAILASVLGALVGVIICSILFIPSVLFVKTSYSLIENLIPWILIGVVILLIAREENYLFALAVSILAGAFGIVVLNSKFIADPLLPLLSGMFGISGLILGLNEKIKIPKQKFEKEIKIKKENLGKGCIAGIVSSCLTCFLPGLSSSHTTMLGSFLSKLKEKNEMLFLNGFANTASMVLSVVALYGIGKGRNGSVVAVSELIKIEPKVILLLVSAMLVSCFFSTVFACSLSKVFCKLIEKVPYKLLTISVIGIVTSITFWLTGLIGLVILAISMCIGFLPLAGKINRNHLMCCLIVPVILYFLL